MLTEGPCRPAATDDTTGAAVQYNRHCTRVQTRSARAGRPVGATVLSPTPAFRISARASSGRPAAWPLICQRWRWRAAGGGDQLCIMVQLRVRQQRSQRPNGRVLPRLGYTLNDAVHGPRDNDVCRQQLKQPNVDLPAHIVRAFRGCWTAPWCPEGEGAPIPTGFSLLWGQLLLPARSRACSLSRGTTDK